MEYNIDYVAHVFKKNNDIEQDHTTRMWDITTGLHLVTTTINKGHKSTVYCMDVIATDESGHGTLFTGSEDSTAKAWDTASGALIFTCEGHLGAVSCMTVMDKLLYTGSHDFCCRSWNTRNGAPLRVYEGHTDIINCLIAEHGVLYTGSYDCTTRVWNPFGGTRNARQLSTSKNHIEPVQAMCVSEGCLVTASTDCDICLTGVLHALLGSETKKLLESGLEVAQEAAQEAVDRQTAPVAFTSLALRELVLLVTKSRYTVVQW
jgi:WD40 repeat protein